MSDFLGKYRGKVVGNIDPQKLGRLQVSVPAVLGDGRMSWAMPCVPYAGDKVGFFAIPPVGANVWVEFEDGNPDYPIWTGCFWGKGELPAKATMPQVKVIRTDTGDITIDDTPGSGGITIETDSGMKIAITSSGIEIDDGNGGSVKLAGNKVSVNDGALDVM